MEKTAPPSASISDPAVKKLYKACIDCVKLLDQAVKDQNNVDALFTTSLTRNRLRECCEKLLFLNPLEFGRKADELLWRKCYYEPIKVLRQSSEVFSVKKKSLLNMLITSGIGYYHLLSLKIQHRFSLNASALTDVAMTTFPSLNTLNEEHKHPGTNSAKMREWATNALHRMLIYQGDLARYLYETDDTTDIRVSQHYYHQALLLKPSNGTPYNQLGTLFLVSNYGLDAAYYYLRGIFSGENFLDSEDNLCTLLKRTDQLLRHLEAKAETASDGTDPSEARLQTFYLNFLSNTSIFYNNEDKREIIQQSCQKTLKSFCDCLQDLNQMDYFVSIGDRRPRTLDASVLLKVFAIQMLVIEKLQSKSSPRLSSCVALLFSMFAVVLYRIFNELNLSTAVSAINEGSKTVESVIEKPASDATSGASLNVGSAKKSALAIRRRRRNSLCESEETAGSDDDDGSRSSTSSIKSEHQKNGESAFTSSGESDEVLDVMDEKDLCLHDLIEQPDEQTKTDTSSNGFSRNNAPAAIQDSDKHDEKLFLHMDPVEKTEWLGVYAPLTVLKVICDWFQCNSKQLLTVQKTSRETWSLFARLVNLLPSERQLNEIVSTETVEPLNFQNGWRQKLPLIEDLAVRGIRSLNDVHQHLDFTHLIHNEAKLEALIRIRSLRAFGFHLITLKTPCFHYDQSRSEFVAKDGRVIVCDNEADDKKNVLMRNMAKLRLKGELETAEQLAWIPVYLVPDWSALCNKLHLIKQLAASGKFIVVIATTAINELDRQKKDSGPARSATRWLETQFQRGNKFVRMQKSSEQHGYKSGSLPPANANFAGILNCCASLRQSVHAGSANSTMVTILTENNPSSDDYKADEEALSNSGLTGVSLANVNNFCNLWDAHRKKAS